MYLANRVSLKAKCVLMITLLSYTKAKAQPEPLNLLKAVEMATQNFPSIKAKQSYSLAAKATAKQAVKDYLPNFVVSAQQVYGTVNGQVGPLYGYGGYGVASSGLPLPNQNWNAAFGALYLTNINWEFYAFGRAREKIRTAQAAVVRDKDDEAQEIFQHKIKVAAAYLNLLAAQRITQSQQNNFARADTFRMVVTARAKNGLIAGVDSSLANAEVANAKIEWIRSIDAEEEQNSKLAFLMGIEPQFFLLDTFFIASIPSPIERLTPLNNHPLLKWYKSRVDVSDHLGKYYNSFKYPSFSIFGIFQTRASGFGANYAVDQSAVSHNYIKGVDPTRSNYLFGVGATWNITSLTRIKHQVAAQHQISEALQFEYQQAADEVITQQAIAGTKMKNALRAYAEIPAQVKAATDGYIQKTILYRNGLADIIEVTQALYAVNRAETNRDIVYNNVWQALLLEAASSGDFSIFENQLNPL